MLLITTNVFAADGRSTEEQSSKSQELETVISDQLEINSLERLQKDLSNRLILGVFGKDALVYSLGTNVSDSVRDEIAMLSMEEVQEYSKPFNVGNLNGLLMILSSFFFVAFTVLAIYFMWVMFEALFNTQDSGQFFGQKTSTLFSVLKGSTAMVLIVPAYGFSHKPFSDFENSIDGSQYGSFSIAQIFVFQSMGYSNQFANHIWGSFVNNYQKAFPTLVLPNTYAKEPEMKEILNHAMCVKSYNDGGIAKVAIKRRNNKSGYYDIESNYRKCELEGSIKYDKTHITALEKEDAYAELVNSIVDYDTLFVSSLEKSLSGAFSRANEYSLILLREASELTDSLEKTGALVNASNWQNLCDNPEGMFEKGKLNLNTLPIIQYYMEKCMSEEYVLSFVDKDKEKARAAYTSPSLTGNNLSLCDEETATLNGGRTYVKNSDIGTSDNAVTKTLEDCLSETCSLDNGLYKCTSALEFVKTSSQNEKMIEQGWLTAGAYSYALFSGFSNNVAQEIVNSLTVKHSRSLLNSTTSPSAGTFNYEIPATNLADRNAHGEYDQIISSTIKSKDLLNAKRDSVAMLMPAGGFAGSQNPDGLFGITKFVTCADNPMSITNGFACGNITEEIHDMGAKMTTFAIELKLATTAGQLISFTKTYSPADKYTASFKSGGLNKMLNFLNTSAGKLSPMLKIMGFGGGASMAVATAFSDTDSYWLQNTETYLALIGLMSGTVPFIQGFVDFVFGLLILLGIIFGFLLPLLPYFLWLTVVAGWAVMIIESLVVAPVWAATLISPSNDHTSKTAKKGLLILMTIMMRAPFMVIGLVLAWILSNSLIGSLLEIANISDALLLTGTSTIGSFIDTFVRLIVYMSLLYFIYNLVFSIIEGFYEIGSNWLFNSSLSPFAAKDRSEKWRGGYQKAGKFIGTKG